MNKVFLNILALGAILLSLASCEKNGANTVPVKNDVVVDATDYYAWNYFNLQDGKVVGQLKYPQEKTGEFFILEGDESSMNWDIAIHRGDIKTNGGSVMATGKTDMAQVTSIPEGDYQKDIEGKVIVDMSKMMEGIIGEGISMINPAFETWYSMEGMPPTFNYTKEVFVLKTSDNRHFKIQFTSYKGDPTGTKSGNIAFNYEELK